MTTTEFSNEFDVLYNNITSNQAPGLDEYEKSVFLTKAQDQILKAYFNPKTNKVQEGFDGSEKRQIDFSMLMRVGTFINGSIDNPEGQSDFTDPTFDTRSNTKAIDLSKLSDPIFMIVNEQLWVLREGSKDSEEENSKQISLTVLPIAYTEYNRIMSKPYKRPLKYNAWRLLVDGENNGQKAELIVGPSDTIMSYKIRYIKRPKPIIVANLDGVRIDGEDKETPCELDKILHPEILQRAVELAKAAYVGDITTTLALGQTSQTNMGIVAASNNSK